MVRIGLDGVLRAFHGETLVARHHLQDRAQGWVTVPEHHRQLWREVLQVARRPLQVYEEVAAWNS